ncbi:TonB-dependent receptor [Colwellia sp. E2M01]|uniref:TonB-dependent receptor domain-containing protein n=1 Tax=Colwellia sp. E2M01 TaxID=2841561 RepID=UPI001C0924A1|nr:TonB-dependent receptor [Colwellia sp. E2M01]MBU2870550.1 TonB-dependent receptor [Colwellia sp. E2M01]
MKIGYLSLIIAAALSNQAYANDIQVLETSKVTSQKGDDIEVSKERLEETQTTDIKGIFKESVGINVSNSTPYSQKVYLRSVEEHSANVTIDGARQDGQMFHHSGNTMVDASMLKAVSVELGASSVLSGYGANVGAIKYETMDPLDILGPEQKFGFKATAGMDTATEYRTFSLSTYGRLTDNFSALAALNWSESGDIETPDQDPIVNKHSELESGLLKLVYDFSDVEQLDFSAQRYDDSGYRTLSGEKPGATTIDEALGFNGYVRDTYTLNYHNSSDNPLLDLSVNAYFNEQKMVRGGSEAPYQPGGSDVALGTIATPDRDYSYKTIGLEIRNTFIINDIAWTGGIESFKSEQAVSARNLEIISLDDGTTMSNDLSLNTTPEASLIGAYIQAELLFGDVTITPGVRYDDYKLGGSYDNSFNQFSPKLTVDWQANDSLMLGFDYGRIFKGPGLPETLTLSGGVIDSSDAKAETGNHYEFNLIQDLSSTLNVDSANFYLNVYHFIIDNYYHPTKNNALTSNYDLSMTGTEAGFRLNHQAYSTYIAYSYDKGENAYPNYTTDNLYSGTNTVKIGATYQASDFVVIGFDSEFASGVNLDETFIEDGNLETADIKKSGYGITNIWLDYQVSQFDGLSVQVAVENLFDKAYQNHESFGMYFGDADYNDNEVGRNFKVTASYQF